MELIKKKVVTIGSSRGVIIPAEKIKKRKEIIFYLLDSEEQKQINKGGK